MEPPRRPPGAPVSAHESQRPQELQLTAPASLARSRKQIPTPSEVLGVFGLSIRTRERDLEDEFSRSGTVEKVVIVYDQRVRTWLRALDCFSANFHNLQV